MNPYTRYKLLYLSNNPQSDLSFRAINALHVVARSEYSRQCNCTARLDVSFGFVFDLTSFTNETYWVGFWTFFFHSESNSLLFRTKRFFTTKKWIFYSESKRDWTIYVRVGRATLKLYSSDFTFQCIFTSQWVWISRNRVFWSIHVVHAVHFSSYG